MKGALTRLDDWMFDRIFQPIVNCFPEEGPARLSSYAIAGCVGTDLAMIWARYAKGALTTADAVLEGISLSVMLYCYFVSLFLPTSSTARNPRRAQPYHRFIRLFSLLSLVLFLPSMLESGLLRIESVLAILSGLCWTAAMYFEACDKPPPRFRRHQVFSALPAEG